MSFQRSFVLLLLTWVAATAQQPAANPPGVNPPAPAPPGVPVPGAVPPAAAGAPAAKAPAPQPEGPLGETKITEDIIEKKLSGDALAGLYRRYTGRRVIVSTAAATAEFSFVQEASPKDPLTYAEAAELLKKAATIEGFVFVPDEQDPNLDVLTFAGASSIRPTGRGVDVYNENDQLPEGDAVISYVMTLSFIKPAEAVNTFTQIIGQFGSYGSIAAVPNASAVVITENTSLIHKLIDLKKEIDKPSSQVATRFIKVQYADVTEIAETLTELLTAQQTAQKTAGVQRTEAQAPAAAPPGVNPGQAAGQPGGSSSGEDTPVQIIPEPRTNRIFAMGRPVDLLFVEGLVHEFDIPSNEKTFLRRKLKFLTVSDFLPIAGDALTRAFSGTGGASATGGATGGQQAKPQSSNRQSSNNSRTGSSSSNSNSRTSGTSSAFGGGSSFGGSSSGIGGSSSGGGGSMGSTLSEPSISSAPESLLVGRTLLVADNITNSLVAQGPPSALEIIGRLLDQIDVKPDQVMISTVIGQLTLNGSKETGVNYLFNDGNFRAGGGSGIPIFSPGTGTGTGTTTTANNFPQVDLSQLGSSGLRLYGTIGDLSLFLKALQSKSDFTVLARPSIFTSNNQKGTISSGEKIAIPTGSNSYGTGNASTQIQYQDVVLKLEVIPLVNSNNEITMQIALLSDEQNGTQTIAGAGGNGANLTVPNISTREILTTATVPNNDTIVLGGLISDKNGKDKSGIPILSDIPYLGRLFSTTTDTKNRSELMVFIQPSVVSNDRSLTAVQNDMDARYDVSGKAHHFADGPGVLPAVGEIPKAVNHDKGGSQAVPVAKPVPAENSAMKPSITPVFRR